MLARVMGKQGWWVTMCMDASCRLTELFVDFSGSLLYGEYDEEEARRAFQDARAAFLGFSDKSPSSFSSTAARVSAAASRSANAAGQSTQPVPAVCCFQCYVLVRVENALWRPEVSHPMLRSCIDGTHAFTRK